MKKNWLYLRCNPGISKLVRKMKITIFLLITAILGTTAAESYSQSAKLTLDLKHSTIKEILNNIENQSEFRFFYSGSVDVERRISISSKDQKVFDVLDELFEGTDVKYEVIGRQIALVKNNESFNFESVQVNQQRTFSGTVTDESGESLPGVTVLVKGSTQGTVTNADGNYSLENVPEDATLVFSFVGMRTQEVEVGGQTTIDVTMVVDAIGIEEVVAIGYGTMKKSDLTGSISSVTSRDLAQIPASNVLEQAQARIAGVDIVRSNGSPGAPIQIRIRGNRSINASNEPLYVVDGIPTSANINEFNPNDIESMEILKDASAVAIYGSRGANGVVLITTKRGRRGKGVISYDSYYGIKKPIENLDLMNPQEFMAYKRVAYGMEPNDSSSDDEIFSNLELENFQKGNITNWFNEVVQNSAVQQEHMVSVSGGSDEVAYYVSGSYFDEQGLIKNTDFDRVAFRVNIDAKVTDKFKLGMSSTVSNTERNQMNNEPYSGALRFSPLTNPYNENGEFLPYPNPDEGLISNPLTNLQPNQYVDETKGLRIFANIFGVLKISNDLTFRLNFGPDYNISRRGRYTGSLDQNINTASINNSNEFNYTLENILTYERKLGNHSLNAVGLFSVQESKLETSNSSAQDLPIERATFYDLGSASTITGVGSSLLRWGLLSYMGRFNYSFLDRYLLTLTGRYDGSSRLAENNKWDFFPAVSMGWILSEEDFFNSNVLPFFKIRASYGEVGNTSISPYQTQGGLVRSVYAYGNIGAFGFKQNSIPNPKLSWETSKTTNIGLDFGLLNGILSGTFEIYNTNTENLLLNRVIPVTSGYSSILQNIGSTRNRGWEFTASAPILKNANGFNWDISLNVFSNKEEITKLFDDKSDDVGNRWFIGEPINVFYSFEKLGIWQLDEAEEAAEHNQEPGEIKIADVNGRDENGEYTNKPDGIIDSDDRKVLGSTVPNWVGGITNRLSWKGIDFSFLIYTRQGHMLNSDYHHIGANNWQGRYNSINHDFWTETNPTNDFPKPQSSEAPLYADAVRYFDASFVKIKNIAIGYTIDDAVLEKINISSLRIYFTANNPITFSKFDVIDPETSGNVGSNNTLTTSTYLFGLNVKF